MPIGLLFSGQGAQAVGMGQSLFENSPAAKALYEEADATLGWSLSDFSFNGPDEELTKTSVCQPALYVHGMAGLAAWREKGGVPEVGAALGLSLGELTALAAAGAFGFATGLKVVAERGRLMQEACEATDGGMASVIGADRETVAKLCEDFDIDMANLNCPGQIVISGEMAKVEAAAADAKNRGARMAKTLNVAGAYHSRLMQGAADKLEAFLEDIEVKQPKWPVFTNTTGGQVSEPAAIKAALVKQVSSSVLWEDCMANAAALGIAEFYEFGPGGVLVGLARRIDKQLSVTAVAEFADIPE